MDLLLFPNQLFSIDILKKHDIKQIHFIEDPLYYGKRPGMSLQLNQLRILFMHVIHQTYIQNLQKHYKVHYYSIEQHIPILKEGFMFEPCDILIARKYKDIKILPSPSFILSLEDLKKLKTTSRLQHSTLYNFAKEKLNILKDTKNMDIYNRDAYSTKIKLPKTPYRHIFSTKETWEAAVKWLNNSAFKNNPKGDLDWQTIITTYLIYLPLTQKDTYLWMQDFFKERFSNYGKYQDVVIPENPLLYHSGLSIYLNNGMITPEEVVSMALKYKNKTDLASLEGFIRQIIGWREYARLYYYTVPKSIYRQNIFKNTRRINNSLYNCSTEIPLVNKTIQYAFNYGYINHIQRLMVMSNYMTLWGYHPDVIFKWMYEFSLDSYEWVMIFNCYSMGSWSDHGKAMRKPYISSANYLLKMSSEKNADWVAIWNEKFKSFLQKHKDILKHTQLANLLEK
jgi:deoxyribodipyrimidine photolyase-related protein